VLAPQQLFPLVTQLQQLLLVSSAWLPGELLQVLLRGGAKAAVAPTSEAGPRAAPPEAVAGFFSVFYERLYDGASVPAALQAAERTWPVLQGAYACYQL
jgi:hypothetical protein